MRKGRKGLAVRVLKISRMKNRRRLNRLRRKIISGRK